MAITPEEKAVLLARLEKARIAKQKKKEETQKAATKPVVPVAPTAPPSPSAVVTPKAPIPKKAPKPKKPVNAVVTAPTPEPTPQSETEPVKEEEPEEVVESEEEEEAPPPPPPVKKVAAKKAQAPAPEKKTKEKFSKIVFYKEPSKSKLKKIMETMHESSSGSESESGDDEPVVKTQQVARSIPQQRDFVPHGMRHLPQFAAPVNRERQEYLRKLSLDYF